MSGRFEVFIDYFLSPRFFSVVLSTLFLVVIVVVLNRFLRGLLGGWRKTLETRSLREEPSAFASAETKIKMISRFLTFLLYFFAFVFFLMQFETVRNIGTGLLASAGLAGIVIGLAAQTTVANLFGGIYISFAQPVRLGDAVIFNGDFGWIEEITLFQTTIRTWDNRRLIAPNSILISQVIQNWTIKDSSLLGVVMIYADYSCDVDLVRGWVRRIVEASPLSTPEKVASVQVLDFSEKAMALRVLVKGADAGKTFELRCEVREKLIKKFKEANLPLPRLRISDEAGSFPPV